MLRRKHLTGVDEPEEGGGPWLDAVPMSYLAAAEERMAFSQCFVSGMLHNPIVSHSRLAIAFVLSPSSSIPQASSFHPSSMHCCGVDRDGECSLRYHCFCGVDHGGWSRLLLVSVRRG